MEHDGAEGRSRACGFDGRDWRDRPCRTTGPAGPAGPAGPTGPAGPAGPAGAKGDTGLAGAIGPIGATGATGPQGANGLRGPEGPAGSQGPKGDPGRPGLASFGQLDGLPCTTAGSKGAIALSFDAADHATLTCVTTPPPVATAVVRVNEVETGTAAAAGDEFVELANTGTGPADIGGWKLVYRAAAGTSDTTLATIPAGTTISAGGFYLLAGSTYSGGQPADTTFGSGLAGAGGAVGLRDATGGLVDSVGWGTAANAIVEIAPAPAPPATTPGSSIVRLPDGQDTGNNAADFTVTPTPTPRASNH